MVSTSFIFKIIAILLLLIIIASLISAMFFLVRDKGASERMVKSLTLRIALSIFLFLLLIFGHLTGLVRPHGSPPIDNSISSDSSVKPRLQPIDKHE